MPDLNVVKAFAKGLLTYIPGATYFLHKKKQISRHSGSEAEFCYALWLSILVLFKENEIPTNFNKIGEIGCGGSLGVGICALLTGCVKYYPLEIDFFLDKELNLKIIDELVILLKNKTRIPDRYKQLNVKINSYEYPADIIKPLFLQESIIAEIKNDIKNEFMNSKRIKIINNWENAPAQNLDFIFSRAVMEHVSAPEKVYEASNYHLKNGSYMFHDIEYHSHGLTKKADGHYFISDNFWKIIFGKRRYFLNRRKEENHINFIKESGFKIIKTQETYTNDLSDVDKALLGAIVIAKKVHG